MDMGAAAISARFVVGLNGPKGTWGALSIADSITGEVRLDATEGVGADVGGVRTGKDACAEAGNGFLRGRPRFRFGAGLGAGGGGGISFFVFPADEISMADIETHH